MSRKVITFAVCDDDDIFLEKMKDRLISTVAGNSSFFFEIECFTFNSGDDLFSYYEMNDIDVVILDIELGKESGFDIAKKFLKIKNDIGIVFATSHNDYVYNSFVCRPLGFIRKNEFEADFDLMLSNIIEYLESRYIIYEFGINNEKTSLKLSEVRAIEFFDHNAHIKLENKELKCRDKISRFENDLEKYGFLKINRGSMLNIKFISSMDGDQIRMLDTSTHSVSRGLKRTVTEKLKAEGII